MNKRIAMLCVILSIFNLCKMLYAETDPHPQIDIPIFPNAHDIKKYVNISQGTKSVSYIVNIKYPATEVLKYYESIFKEKGWIPSLRDNFEKKEWDCFIDGLRPGNPYVRQLLGLWSNAQLDLEAALALIYIKNGKNWGNELNVLCQIQPKIDTTKLDAFFRKLEESNKRAEFVKILDVYRKPNGEVDLEKAIIENPKNIYLKEYKSIIDKMSGNKK